MQIESDKHVFDTKDRQDNAWNKNYDIRNTKMQYIVGHHYQTFKQFYSDTKAYCLDPKKNTYFKDYYHK